jgi:hypothetical protein
MAIDLKVSAQAAIPNSCSNYVPSQVDARGVENGEKAH